MQVSCCLGSLWSSPDSRQSRDTPVRVTFVAEGGVRRTPVIRRTLLPYFVHRGLSSMYRTRLGSGFSREAIHAFLFWNYEAIKNEVKLLEPHPEFN